MGERGGGGIEGEVSLVPVRGNGALYPPRGRRERDWDSPSPVSSVDAPASATPPSRTKRAASWPPPVAGLAARLCRRTFPRLRRY